MKRRVEEIGSRTESASTGIGHLGAPGGYVRAPPASAPVSGGAGGSVSAPNAGISHDHQPHTGKIYKIIL